jgi:hypothetical protein
MMKQRCSSPNNKRWAYYGAKGVRVCDRWLTFENFLEDMGAGWAPGLSIERINNAGDYEPENCTWIPRAQQTRNRTSTRWVESPWGRITATEAAGKLGMTVGSFCDRLDSGWEGERLFSPPRRWN